MPRSPLPQPEFSDPNASAADQPRARPEASFETDLADLSARFSALGGSPELSSDLALQIVLNEIVEQACLATGASGAAIALQRDVELGSELVCRACTGTTAPELGTPVDTGQGLSGECVRTGEVQVCDDTQTDSRVDAVASRHLGVRSVIVLPLVRRDDRGDALAGVLEAFSTRPSAFGIRDQRTLEALAQRVLNNMKLAAQWSPEAAAAPRPQAVPAAELPQPNSSATAVFDAGSSTPLPPKPLSPDLVLSGLASPDGLPDAGLPDLHLPDPVSPAREMSDDVETRERAAEPAMAMAGAESRVRPNHSTGALTAILGVIVLLTAIGLSARALQRLGWIGTESHSLARPTTAAASGGLANAGSANLAANSSGVNSTASAAPAAIAGRRSSSGSASNVAASSVRASNSLSSAARSGGVEPALPPGGLRVYENGREVFHMLPSGPGAPSGEPGSQQNPAMQEAAQIEPEASTPSASSASGVMQLPASLAEANLLSRVEPEYPEEARLNNIRGLVVLDVRARRDGSVEQVKLMSGQPLLAAAAIAAVKQWRFKPQLVKGQPVAIETTVTLNFRLPQ